MYIDDIVTEGFETLMKEKGPSENFGQTRVKTAKKSFQGIANYDDV